MGKDFDKRRVELRTKFEGLPLKLSPGLAHVVATVLEPRSNGAAKNVAFNEIRRGEAKRLLQGIEDLQGRNPDIPPEDLGGQIEQLADETEKRLRRAAEQVGATDVVERLRRLDEERRDGVSASEQRPADTPKVDLSNIPRYADSGRRIGLWR